MSDEEKVEYLIITLRQVVACFKSRVDSSTCIENHHPSCLVFIEGRMEKVNDQRGEAQGS